MLFFGGGRSIFHFHLGIPSFAMLEITFRWFLKRRMRLWEAVGGAWVAPESQDASGDMAAVDEALSIDN